MEVFDPCLQKVRKVVPVLAIAYADTPARAKLALTPGHSGRTPCDKCGVRSVRTLSDGHVIKFNALRGYIASTHALIFHAKEREENAAEEWEAVEANYGQKGRFNPHAGAPLLISTVQDAMRSLNADLATSKAAQLHPLPSADAHGGGLRADPNTTEERLLSQSVIFFRLCI